MVISRHVDSDDDEVEFDNDTCGGTVKMTILLVVKLKRARVGKQRGRRRRAKRCD